MQILNLSRVNRESGIDAYLMCSRFLFAQSAHIERPEFLYIYNSDISCTKESKRLHSNLVHAEMAVLEIMGSFKVPLC